MLGSGCACPARAQAREESRGLGGRGTPPFLRVLQARRASASLRRKLLHRGRICSGSFSDTFPLTVEWVLKWQKTSFLVLILNVAESNRSRQGWRQGPSPSCFDALAIEPWCGGARSWVPWKSTNGAGGRRCPPAVTVLAGTGRLRGVGQLRRRHRACSSRTCCRERGIAEAKTSLGARQQIAARESHA